MGKAAKRARQKQGRQERMAAAEKAAKQRRARNRNIFLIVAVAVVLLALGYKELTKPKSTPAAAATPSTSVTPTDSAAGVAATPSAASTTAACSTAKPTETATPVSQSTPPAMTISQSKTYTATIDTSCGAFRVVLDQKDSPNAVNSFVYLADKGFFNGLTFHRIVKNFAIQGGDPKGDGTGGPGYQTVDPIPRGTTYSPGTVAMANAGTTGGGGSQFFVVPDAPNVAAGYSPLYAILGHVSSGLDTTVKALNNVPTVASPSNPSEISSPNPKVYIYSVTISTS